MRIRAETETRERRSHVCLRERLSSTTSGVVDGGWWAGSTPERTRRRSKDVGGRASWTHTIGPGSGPVRAAFGDVPWGLAHLSIGVCQFSTGFERSGRRNRGCVDPEPRSAGGPVSTGKRDSRASDRGWDRQCTLRPPDKKRSAVGHREHTRPGDRQLQRWGVELPVRSAGTTREPGNVSLIP